MRITTVFLLALFAIVVVLTTASVEQAQAHGIGGRIAHHHGWLAVFRCEHGGALKWRDRVGTYHGAGEWHPDTWTRAIRGTKVRAQYAYQAEPWQQIAIAERWRKRIGGDPAVTAGWPDCGTRWF